MGNVTPSLVGVRAKIRRAEHHHKEFQTSWRAIVPSRVEAYTAFLNRKINRTTEPVAPPEMPIEWQLMLGDFIHNLRTSLDHLACQLALLETKSWARSRRLSFPIFSERTNDAVELFTDNLPKRLSPEALALIERFQPYNGFTGTDTDSIVRLNLRRLAKLNNIDKHQMLVVVEDMQRLDAIDVTVGEKQLRLKTRTRPWVPIHHEAKIILEYTVPIDSPEAKMNVDIAGTHRTLGIVFRDTSGVCDGEQVLDILKPMYRAVSRVVDECDGAFFR